MKKWASLTAVTATAVTGAVLVGAAPAGAATTSSSSVTAAKKNCGAYPPRRPTLNFHVIVGPRGVAYFWARLIRGTCPINGKKIVFKRGNFNSPWRVGHDTTGRFGFAFYTHKFTKPGTYTYTAVYGGQRITIHVRVPRVAPAP
jgi:hypothetical protein